MGLKRPTGLMTRRGWGCGRGRAVMRWFWQRKPAELCTTCLDHARASALSTVYVYRNGHILRTHGPRLPTLDEWPATSDIVTFCGLDVYGMGASRLYALNHQQN